MHFVSEVAENLMFKLVAWEFLNRDDFDPKTLLRALPLADLKLIVGNMENMPNSREFLSTQMVKVEMLYRLGQLKEDWRIGGEGVLYVLDHQMPFLNSLSPRWVGAEA